ncbi:MAG: hypothetical protein K0Q49_1132 [Haloplasmataceae bacterium]|jgi:1-acyl-sn-glycerol-3-phosphate acyltransferase|nr:hypothetical protein [Haloplasmataceae bacterium]
MGRKRFKKDLAFYVFQILRYPLKLFIKSKLNIKLIKNEAKNDLGPFFITGNHISAYDPLISLVYVKPLVKFVAADANYDNKLKKFLFDFAGIIPISKNYQDIRTIKHLLNEVKRKNAVGLYPEGGRNWNGETDKLIYSTSKLIKLLKISVYVQKLEGAYMTSPRWGKTLRKGVTNVTIYKVLDSQDIQKMTDEEIFNVLEKELYHNDYNHQRNAMVKLKGKDHAEYIERVIYVCPKCNAIDSFTSHGDTFHCIKCEAIGKVNKYGFIEGDFKYDNLVDWDHFQKGYLHQYLLNLDVEPIFMNQVKYKLSEDKSEKQEYIASILFDNQDITLEFDNKKVIIKINDITEPSITFKNTLIFHENNIRHEILIEPFIHHHSIVYIKELLSVLKEKGK